MNILSAWPWRGQIQIFVVVFESDESEELMKWLQDVCEPALSEGLLVLAKARLPDGWHASIAKNTAHRLAVETLLQAAGGSAPQPTASGSGPVHSSLDGCFLLGLAWSCHPALAWWRCPRRSPSGEEGEAKV